MFKQFIQVLLTALVYPLAIMVITIFFLFATGYWGNMFPPLAALVWIASIIAGIFGVAAYNGDAFE